MRAKRRKQSAEHWKKKLDVDFQIFFHPYKKKVKMQSSFTYSISDDFPSGTVNIENLQNEIRASNISISLSGISSIGDQVTIDFKASLSSSERLILDGNTSNPALGLISAHDATQKPNQTEITTVIKEEYGTTGGRFFSKTVVVFAEADSETIYDENLLVDTSALMIRYKTKEEHEGDEIDLHIAPNTVVGTLSADVNVGDSVITVSQSVIQNVFVGPCLLSLFDGMNEISLGRIKNIDAQNMQIETEFESQNNFSASTPTFVRMTITIIENRIIGDAWEYTIGSSKIGGSFVPQNTTVRFRYRNKSPARNVGEVTENVSIGVTELTVDQSVCKSLFCGDRVALVQLGTDSDIGSIEKIDKNQSKIFFSIPTSSALDMANGVIFVQKTAKKFIAHIEMLQ